MVIISLFTLLHHQWRIFNFILCFHFFFVSIYLIICLFFFCLSAIIFIFMYRYYQHLVILLFDWTKKKTFFFYWKKKQQNQVSQEINQFARYTVYVFYNIFFFWLYNFSRKKTNITFFFSLPKLFFKITTTVVVLIDAAAIYIDV